MFDANHSEQHLIPGRTAPAANARNSPILNRAEDVSPLEFAKRILAGDRLSLARAITLMESSRLADHETAGQILESCLKPTDDSIRVGVTGIPGAGKSSLIEALGKHIIKQRGEKVAVLAIDPSSRLSGGSILGDKTRMPFLASSEMAFVRPSPTRGVGGGVAQQTREAILLCEAAGYRNILVETVGVGQSEAAVHDVVDIVLLVTIPGAGDELQGIKRGVVEMADLVAVNKADGDNLAAAERARIDLDGALHLLSASPSGWKPSAAKCSAQEETGVSELWASVLTFAVITRANGQLQAARDEQSRRGLHDVLEQELIRMFRANPEVQQRLSSVEQEVVDGKTTMLCAVRTLRTLFASRLGVEQETKMF